MTALNLKITSLVLFCVTFFAAHAQNNGTDTGFIYKANVALNELAVKQPTEKVYLHLDKPYYAAGDDIWFKAYLVSGDMHQPSGISGVLTVELANETGDPVKTLQLAVKQGVASGDFHLPYTFAAGKYHIRAYTNYMRNAGIESFFDQPLNIAGITKQDKLIGNIKPPGKANLTTQSLTTLTSNADVQFFPESGSLVNGITSRIAFKAIGESGMGINVKAVVVDNTGAEVTRFTSQHLGMGSFNLNPVPGKSYTAKLTFDDSSHKVVNIPTALNFGYGLRIANNKENKDVIYQVSYINNAAIKNAADSTLNLIVRSAGSISYAAKIRLKRTSTIGRIPKDKLPTGISQFTLFSQSGEALCERLIFINNGDQLNIDLTDSNKINTTHQLTTIKLKVKDADSKPVNGYFSAAVMDDNIVPDNNLTGEENILSYLLLTSDIKGKIEAPGYYFKKDNDTTAADLDLLMLTQGYRHFEWKKILNNNNVTSLPYQPENGITVSGHLVTGNNKPVAKGRVTFFYKPDMLLLDTVADDRGNFIFNNMIFTDSLKVSITAKTADGKKDVQVVVDKRDNIVVSTPNLGGTLPVITSAPVPVDTIPASYRQFVIGRYKRFPNNGEIMLNEVKVNSIRINPMASKFSSNLNGPGNADQVLTVKDIENQGGSLGDILQSKVRGVIVINDTIISGMQNTLSGKRVDNMMKIIIDGAYYTGSLKGIDPSTIESIEILRHGIYTAIYGSGGANGIVIITTKSTGSNKTDYSSAENSANITLQGFYKAREFYSPKYDSNKANTDLGDMRSTIYWNPNIITDNNGNASFSYFNSGEKSTYRVIVQGIDINGKLGYQLFKYKVE